VQGEGICLQETFATFLREMEKSIFDCCSEKALLEKEVLRIMGEEGFSQQQIYEMPLKKLLDLFYGAYIWQADKKIISNSATTIFL
jgi:hypothetical protein